MLLDWQFDFWEKDRYICNAMPKRQEKPRMFHAVGSLQLALHSEMWLYLYSGTQLQHLWPQTGDCLSAVQRQLCECVKVRELAPVESGALCRVTRFTVAAISIRSVSQSDRAVTLAGSSLSPQAACWGWPRLWMQEGFSRALLVKSWHLGYILSTTHLIHFQGAVRN